MQRVHSLVGEESLEKEMAKHSNIILAWRIPWTEELVHRVTKSLKLSV